MNWAFTPGAPPCGFAGSRLLVGATLPDVFDAVLFDFGGVITTSPFEGFARYEREAGLPEGLIRRINSTNPDDNAWARYERSEIDRPAFEAPTPPRPRRSATP